MKPTAPLALALCLTLPVSTYAQQASPRQTPFTDPANLRGERVSPTDAHELPIDHGALGLAQLLRKLNTRASILNIVAHPDDEDGGMLTLYARGLGARVTDLSLTRGEGGQNFVTGDFEDALGLIRTQELLANDRYTGVQQLFGTEVDFGFSKTKEEAFAKWTHDRVLYDAVRAIRLVRPLVITATFVGGVTDGHGQHQVSGQIAQEAFVAAADPNVFPDQIAEGLLPWQALKVYARVPFADINAKGVYDYATGQYVAPHFVNYVTGKVSTTKPSTDVVVPEGTPDPLFTTAAACEPSIISTRAPNNSVISTGAQRSGETCSSALPTTPLSYIQFARIGLSLQRTQISKNMTLPVSGSYNSGYTLYGSILCNAPATARFPLKNSVILSEGRSPQSKDPCILPAAALPPSAANTPNTPQALSSRPESAHLADVAERPAAPPASPQSSEAFPPQTLTAQPNFFTGIDTSIEGIATLAPSDLNVLKTPLQLIASKISEAQQLYDPTNTEKAARPLAEAEAQLGILLAQLEDESASVYTRQYQRRSSPSDALQEDQRQNVLHELRVKSAQLDEALILSLGLRLDATAASLHGDLAAGSAPEATVTVTKSTAGSVSFFAADITNETGKEIANSSEIAHPKGIPLTEASAIKRTLKVEGDGTTELSRPYFSRPHIEQPVYDLIHPVLRNAPATPPALVAYASVKYQDQIIQLARIVHDGPQPISIIPPVSIASAPTATVLPDGQTTAQLLATLRTDATISANINVESPHNWSIEAKAAGPNSVNFDLHPTAPLAAPHLFKVTAQTSDHHTYTEGFRPVGYSGLILTNYYTPATTRVVLVDLKLPAHVRIAYLPGTGDNVPAALASIGLAPTLITVTDLTPTNLANFDTVILGVRAYTAHPELHGALTHTLLDFARNGGNVLVQYQSSDFASEDAPYPLSLAAGEKVVDETAPVQLLAASNPLLTTPNQIAPADFNGWVEERGHGFLDTFDPHYTVLTETHDPGGPETAVQLPQRGGLVTTTVGKGRWTYCAFALYRQLPEAVPGAFRLFVNLLTPGH